MKIYKDIVMKKNKLISKILFGLLLFLSISACGKQSSENLNSLTSNIPSNIQGSQNFNSETNSIKDEVIVHLEGTEGLEYYPINDYECAVSVGKGKLLKEIVLKKESTS